jgi:hypothetical protein
MHRLLPLALLLGCAADKPTDTSPVPLDTSDVSADTADLCTDEELACDGVDEDCDGVVDDGLLEDFFVDADGDGYGGAETRQACPSGGPDLTLTGGDCDDGDAAIHPGSFDRCDGVDQDCDGEVDEDAPVGTWYADADGDGYGYAATAVSACEEPSGHATVAGDCDDAAASVNPGATEACDNDVDDDCDGAVDDVSHCCVSTALDTDRFVLCDAGAPWAEAVAACAADGATLHVPRSQAENDFVWDLGTWAGDAVWIDLTDAAEAGTWVSSTGAAPPWNGWDDGQPDSDGDCALVRESTGGWAASDCAVARPFLCRLP